LEKVKVEHVEEQKLNSKVDLWKVKVEHLEKGSTSNIQVEIVNQIYNQRFQNYLKLPLDPKIHNSICCIKELQES
jgi:hypothetical protein